MLKASKEEMLKQLNALQSEVAQLTSTLDMIPGGFGPRRPIDRTIEKCNFELLSGNAEMPSQPLTNIKKRVHWSES
jgi:hypothetical protein